MLRTTGSRSGCTTRPRRAVRRRAGRARRAGAAHRGARAGRSPAADLVLVNDDDLTYAKIRLDERSLARCAADRRVATRAAGAVLVGGLGHDPRRGAAGPRLGQLVLAGMGAETEISVVQSLLARVQPALSLVHRSGLGARRVDLARRPRSPRSSPRPAGSDVQLLWSRTFAAPRAPRARRGAARSARRLRTSGLDVDTDAALGAALRAWSRRRRRRRRDRRRGRSATRRRPASGAPPRRGRSGRPRSEGGGLAAGLRRRRPAELRARGAAARLLAPGAARAHGGLRRAVLRGDRRRSGTGAPARSRRTPSSTCSRPSSSRGRRAADA